MNNKNTVRDLLGIDMDDMGLDEAIDNVTDSFAQMNAVRDAIGRAIFIDGGLLEDGEHFSKNMIKDIAWNSERVMNMLEHYARQSPKFMERL
jgi:hypothetical protein